jgi:DnaJ-class molecular chaperone
VLVLVAPLVLAAAPVEEYQTRQSKLDRELAAEYYALGVWCREQELLSEAREQFERVLALDPTHPGAAQKLAELTTVPRAAKELKCEIHLLSGELVKAELMTENFKLETVSGFLIVPAGEVDLIQLGAVPKPDVFTSDSYTGEGRVKAESFSAVSKVGRIAVKRQDVATIRILRPCPVCGGRAELKCRRCAGTGRLNEKSTCPDCNGKGWIKCQTCGGTGKTTCPLCGGRGEFRGAWGRMHHVQCPRCQGTGKVACADCQNGRVVCPTCKGKPVSTTAGECPVCKGRKTVVCEACGGTGTKPLPKTEAEQEKKTEEPPKVEGKE